MQCKETIVSEQNSYYEYCEHYSQIHSQFAYDMVPFLVSIKIYHINLKPISVAALSKAWVYGRSPAGTVVSNPAGDMDFCLL